MVSCFCRLLMGKKLIENYQKVEKSESLCPTRTSPSSKKIPQLLFIFGWYEIIMLKFSKYFFQVDTYLGKRAIIILFKKNVFFLNEFLGALIFFEACNQLFVYTRYPHSIQTYSGGKRTPTHSPCMLPVR